MKKNRKKTFILAAMAGLLIFTPVRGAYVQNTAYAAQVPQADPHDSRLSAFDIAPGTLSPAFSPDVFEYTSTVDAGVTDVRVQAVPRSSRAVIASIEGRNGLHPGVNTIKATCSAEDNTFTVYTITLTVGSADAGAQQPDNTGTMQPDNGSVDAGAQQPDSTGTQHPDAGAQQPDSTGTQQPGAGAQQPEGMDTAADAENAGKNENDNKKDKNKGKNKKKDSSTSELISSLTGKVNADGTVALSGASYQISGDFVYGATTQDIPSAFGQGSVQIGENTYNTLYCESAGIHLVYMKNTDGNGSTGFYYYDEKQNAVERFKYTGIGDNFVVFVSFPGQEIPAGFQETSLTLPSGKEVASYQNLASEDLKDYYVIYGRNSNGSDGWYLYDNTQGTYMRYADGFAAVRDEEPDDEEEEVARTVSLAKYNSLNEKYTQLKQNRVRIVSIFAIVLVVLIIIFTAVLLHGRDDEDEDDEEEREKSRTKRQAQKAKRPKKQPETMSKSSLAAGRNFEGSTGKKAKKVTKTFTQEPARAPKASSAQSGYPDGVSTPEEIRAQVNSAKQVQTALHAQQQKSPRKRETAGTPDSVQLAAERMRQSVKYPRKNVKTESAQPQQEHDPMDDWDMEETAARKQQKSGRSARKKRSLMDEDDIEVMDLNDL